MIRKAMVGKVAGVVLMLGLVLPWLFPPRRGGDSGAEVGWAWAAAE
jgi:hypothetical protein